MINIQSEYSALQVVLVHEPDEEINALTRENRKALLFEDFPYLEAMKQEHREFVATLHRESGAEVLYLERLLREVLELPATKTAIVHDVVVLETCESLEAPLLELHDLDYLLSILLRGLPARDLPKLPGAQSIDLQGHDYFVIPPLPNLYFTRDPAAAVADGVVLSKMHYRARMREALLTKHLFTSHPRFRGTQIHFGESRDEQNPFTIEGGDILVLNDKAIAIGCSERTRSESIRRLSRNLFLHTSIERVYEVQIPFLRDFMHLDTVLTIIAPDVVVAYPDALEEVLETRVYHPQDVAGTCIAYPSLDRRPFLEVLQEELGKYEIIPTAGGDARYASREQIGDGTNVLAIAPRKVITYDRNKYTNAALKNKDIEVIPIRGSELVRGLGGPRCMTMPLVRR